MKIIADNKKARFNYQILEEYEAGIMLSGPEVKSVKSGHISLKESFVTASGSELFLTNAHISPYGPAQQKDYNPTRPRKLLLKKTEIIKLVGKAQIKGNTMIPIKAYLKNGLVKIEFGLARGKNKYDKRQTIKERDIERDASRELSSKK